jgi:hypothetical protein
MGAVEMIDAVEAAKEQKARVLNQLVNGALERYPDEDRLKAGDPDGALEYLEYFGPPRVIPEEVRTAAQRLVLYRSGFGGQHWVYRSGEEGWAWYPRGCHPLILLAPARDFDPARWARDEARRHERVAFAHELAITFEGILPRDIIIQIYLEVFWSA